MPHYALTLIEVPDSGRKLQPGAIVPDDLPGLADLVKGGAISEVPPEPDVTRLDDGTYLIGAPAVQVARYDGDFTEAQIENPKVDTPLLGVHINASVLEAQESAVDAGEGTD